MPLAGGQEAVGTIPSNRAARRRSAMASAVHKTPNLQLEQSSPGTPPSSGETSASTRRRSAESSSRRNQRTKSHGKGQKEVASPLANSCVAASLARTRNPSSSSMCSPKALGIIEEGPESSGYLRSGGLESASRGEGTEETPIVSPVSRSDTIDVDLSTVGVDVAGNSGEEHEKHGSVGTAERVGEGSGVRKGSATNMSDASAAHPASSLLARESASPRSGRTRLHGSPSRSQASPARSSRSASRSLSPPRSTSAASPRENDQLSWLRLQMEEQMAQRERKVRREVERQKEEEYRQAVTSIRKELGRTARAERELTTRERLVAEKARRTAEEDASRSISSVSAVAAREQREAVRVAVEEATRKLTARHAIELTTLREEHEKRIAATEVRFTKQLSTARQKAAAAEAARWERSAAEKLKVATQEAEVAHKHAAEAQAALDQANLARAEAEDRSSLQAKRASELIMSNEARVELARAHAESLQGVVTRLDEERSGLLSRTREHTEAEMSVCRMHAQIEIMEASSRCAVAIAKRHHSRVAPLTSDALPQRCTL